MDDIENKIKKAIEAGNVEMAPQEGMDSFDAAFTAEFLSSICEAPGAWVSDMSDLSDFSSSKPSLERVYARIESKYGVDVRGKDNLLEIFRIIHGVNRTLQ